MSRTHRDRATFLNHICERIEDSDLQGAAECLQDYVDETERVMEQPPWVHSLDAWLLRSGFRPTRRGLKWPPR